MNRGNISLETRCLTVLCEPWVNGAKLIDHRTSRIIPGREAEAELNARLRQRGLAQMKVLPLRVKAKAIKCLARRGGVDDEVLRELCSEGLPLGNVDLRECDGVSDAGCHSLAIAGDCIRSLDLQLTQRRRENISLDGLSVLLPRAMWLQGLKLNRCILVDDQVCQLIVDNMKTLRLLSLGSCPRVTDDGVEAIATLSTLYSLVLSSTSVTDRGCVAIAHGRTAATLMELQLSKTEITDAGVTPLIANCRRLKNLLLDGVRGVTPECRERLEPPANGRGYVSWTVY